MKTTRTIFNQQRNSRYGKSSQSQEQKLSQSFFNSIKQYNTINVAKQPYLNPQTDDEKITLLTQKNQRLKSQINKIQQVFQQLNEQDIKAPIKSQYGIKLPQIRTQVIDKELQNAYKQIKLYEVQINKLKKLQGQGTFSNRITMSEKILKQKLQVKDRLKTELQNLQKSSKHLTKSLTDDRSKIFLQEKSKKLNDELKMYEKKWSQEERKRLFFEQTQKKKSQHAGKLQRQLLISGVSQGSIQELRRQIFQESSIRIKQDSQTESAQDRSPESYKSLMDEVKLLKKVTSTNQKLFEKLQSQKDDFVEKNKKAVNRLQQIQREINFMETQIGFMKKHIDPNKLRPFIKQSSFNFKLTTNSFISEEISSNSLANRSKAILQHHFQFVQIGVISKRSQKFNDRKILGKRSAKIVALEFYENRMQLLGFRFTYQVQQGERMAGTLMQMKNDNQRYLQKKQFSLVENDYFTSVQCFINQKSIIVGMILISQSGQVAKAGSFQTQKQFLQLTPKQYPACAYTCIGKQGIELFGVQKIEALCF